MPRIPPFGRIIKDIHIKPQTTIEVRTEGKISGRRISTSVPESKKSIQTYHLKEKLAPMQDQTSLNAGNMSVTQYEEMAKMINPVHIFVEKFFSSKSGSNLTKETVKLAKEIFDFCAALDTGWHAKVKLLMAGNHIGMMNKNENEFLHNVAELLKSLKEARDTLYSKESPSEHELKIAAMIDDFIFEVDTNKNVSLLKAFVKNCRQQFDHQIFDEKPISVAKKEHMLESLAKSFDEVQPMKIKFTEEERKFYTLNPDEIKNVSKSLRIFINKNIKTLNSIETDRSKHLMTYTSELEKAVNEYKTGNHNMVDFTNDCENNIKDFLIDCPESPPELRKELEAWVKKAQRARESNNSEDILHNIEDLIKLTEKIDPTHMPSSSLSKWIRLLAKIGGACMLACIGYAVWDTIQDVFRNFKKSMLEHIKDLEIPYNKEKIEEMRNKFKFGLLPELIKIEELRGSISKLKKQIEHWESRTGKECPGLDDIKRTLHSMESHLDQLETMVGIKKEDAFDAAYIKKKQISEMKDAEIYELTKKESKFNEILETIDQEWNYIMKSGLHDFLKDINGYLGKQIDNLKYMDIKFETRELELQKARPGLLSRIMGSHEEEVEKIDLELKQIKKERAYIERLRLQLIDESERLSRDDIKLDLGVRKSTPKRVEGSPVEQLAISHLTDIQSFNVNMLHELKHLDQQKSKLVKQFPHLFSLDALD